VSLVLRPGTKLRSTTGPTEVVVIRAPADPVEITCGGAPMEPSDTSAPAGAAAGAAAAEEVLLGKRYADDGAGIELLCSKAGPGPLACDGTELTIKGAKPLPSSD
jgi:hypothetical protein